MTRNIPPQRHTLALLFFLWSTRLCGALSGNPEGVVVSKAKTRPCELATHPRSPKGSFIELRRIAQSGEEAAVGHSHQSRPLMAMHGRNERWPVPLQQDVVSDSADSAQATHTMPTDTDTVFANVETLQAVKAMLPETYTTIYSAVPDVDIERFPPTNNKSLSRIRVRTETVMTSLARLPDVQANISSPHNGSKESTVNNSEKEPFAEETTTNKTVTKTKSQKVNDTHTLTENTTITETVVELKVASPKSIISIYIVLYVPLLMAWATLVHYGLSESQYLIALPITVVIFLLGFDLVNQSLILVLKAPIAVTVLQSVGISVITGVWSATVDHQELKHVALGSLASWFPVSILFALHQLANHFVYLHCSLSERTVFLNLCPVLALGLEVIIMPRKLRPELTFRIKLALACMVVGAVLFALQSSEFDFNGMFWASLLVLSTVPYRCLQRYVVASIDIPVAFLSCIDSLTLVLPSVVIESVYQSFYTEDLGFWIINASFIVMVLLSVVSFTGGHVCALLMLKQTSATAYIVFQNGSNFLSVASGVIFFGEMDELANGLAVLGLVVCLSSGLWYAFEVINFDIRRQINVDSPTGSPRGTVGGDPGSYSTPDVTLPEKNTTLQQPTA